MSDKLPMTREMISEEMSKIDPISRWAILLFAEHILRIGTTELREENKRLILEIDALRNVIADGETEEEHF